MDNCWINLKFRKKQKDTPEEIRIDFDGNVYVDGVLYNKETSPYKNLTVDIERHNRMNTGEETLKIIESSKTAKKGETIIISDIKGPEKTESTTVQF